MTDFLSFDDITTADDIEYREVPVPEWGGTVRLKGLTGLEADAFEASKTTRRVNPKTQGVEYLPNNKNLRARLVALAMVDGGGRRLVPDNKVDALGTKSAGVLDRLADVVQEMSGMTKDAEDEIKADFDDAPSEDSTSD